MVSNCGRKSAHMLRLIGHRPFPLHLHRLKRLCSDEHSRGTRHQEIEAVIGHERQPPSADIEQCLALGCRQALNGASSTNYRSTALIRPESPAVGERALAAVIHGSCAPMHSSCQARWPEARLDISSKLRRAELVCDTSLWHCERQEVTVTCLCAKFLPDKPKA
jgi:hypothetical protein